MSTKIINQVSLTKNIIDTQAINKNMHNALKKYGHVGAIASFTGIVRSNPDEKLTKLVLEHYPGMTEKKLTQLVDEAITKWQLLGVSLTHRFDKMIVGDVIVYVVVAATHRQDAFSACSAIVDRLKSDVPFWKKEYGSFGERWVAAKDNEDQYKGKYK